jgi:hypothetical protein
MYWGRSVLGQVRYYGLGLLLGDQTVAPSNGIPHLMQ